MPGRDRESGEGLRWRDADHRRSRQRGDDDRSGNRRPAHGAYHQSRSLHRDQREGQAVHVASRWIASRHLADDPEHARTAGTERDDGERPARAAQNFIDGCMKLLIVLPHRFELWNPRAWLAGRLRADFPDLEVAQLSNYDAIREQLADTDILVTRSLRSEHLPISNQLRWIHSPAAGVHVLRIPEIVRGEIVVTNSREINGVVVAEHVLATIFALAKCLPLAVQAQQRHKWAQAEIWARHPKEIAGSSLGLVGLGAIGREVAVRGKALGMRGLAGREDTSKPVPPGVD